MLSALTLLLAPMVALGSPLARRHFTDDVPSGLVSALEPDTSAWYSGFNEGWKAFDGSCNVTQLELIAQGIEEATTLAAHGRAHLRRFGNDTFFQRWFGNTNSVRELQGLYDRIVEGDKGNLSVTCADPDNLCNGAYGVLQGYFGQTTENLLVICPTYYDTYKSLDHFCTGGDTIAEGSLFSTYGSFTLHQLLHLEQSSGGGLADVETAISAYDAIALAHGNATQQASAILNRFSHQYYVLDTYANDVLLPGVGCLGDTSVDVPITERRSLNEERSNIPAWAKAQQLHH